MTRCDCNIQHTDPKCKPPTPPEKEKIHSHIPQCLLTACGEWEVVETSEKEKEVLGLPVFVANKCPTCDKDMSNGDWCLHQSKVPDKSEQVKTCVHYCKWMKKMCSFGGNKRYSFGFVSGTSGYCWKKKCFTHEMEECPLDPSVTKTPCPHP